MNQKSGLPMGLSFSLAISTYVQIFRERDSCQLLSPGPYFFVWLGGLCLHNVEGLYLQAAISTYVQKVGTKAEEKIRIQSNFGFQNFGGHQENIRVFKVILDCLGVIRRRQIVIDFEVKTTDNSFLRFRWSLQKTNITIFLSKISENNSMWFIESHQTMLFIHLWKWPESNSDEKSRLKCVLDCFALC